MRSSIASTTLQKTSYRTRDSFLRGRGLLTLLLGIAFIWSLTSVNWTGSIVHPGGISAIGEFFKAALAPEMSGSFLRLTLESAWTTVAYAVAGVSLAMVLGLPLGILASGVLTRPSSVRVAEVIGFRFLLGVLRAVHELVWAWLFVVAIGLLPIAAILALAIPYGGILGRIYADILNDVPQEPLRALRSSAASECKVLLYGQLPMALPDMVSYSFYRFECAIRAAAIMGFVGIGGLGMQIQLSINDLLYNEVWTLLYALIGLIFLLDVWSNWIRRSLTQ